MMSSSFRSCPASTAQEPRSSVVCKARLSRSQILKKDAKREGFQNRRNHDDPFDRHGRSAREFSVSRLEDIDERGSRPQTTGAYQNRRDNRGWWEKENEAASQGSSSPLEELTPSQVQQLEQAYAEFGRRKVPVQQLANELQVHRSVVLEWLKHFSQQPASARREIAQQRREELASRTRSDDSIAALRRGMQESAAKRAGKPEEEKGKGFVPFLVRKQQMMGGDRPPHKLKADAIQTLELLYDKAPYLSEPAARSLWDLHRMPRTVAVDWFAQRRREDGLQKRGRSGTEQEASRQDYAERRQQPFEASTSGTSALGRLSATMRITARQPRDAAGSSGSDAEAEVEADAPSVNDLPREQRAALTFLPSPRKSAHTRPEATELIAGMTASPRRQPANPPAGDVPAEGNISSSSSSTVNTGATTPASSSSSQRTARSPVSEEEEMEELVQAYSSALGEVLDKVGDDVDELKRFFEARRERSSWRQAWAAYRMRLGPPTRLQIDWNVWLKQLLDRSEGVEEEDEVDIKLAQLDAQLSSAGL